MKKIVLLLFLLAVSTIAYPQLNPGPTAVVGKSIWMGAKIGSGLVLNQYQDNKYKDSYNFNSKPLYNLGILLAVAGSDNYGLYSELNFEQRFRKVYNDPKADIPDVTSDATYNYLTLPLIMQFKMKPDPRWTVFAGVGGQISCWLGGKTMLIADELKEFTSGGEMLMNYRVRKSPRDEGPNNMYIPNAHRFQYGLVLSAGTMFDVKEYQRIFVDARLGWAHSNLGQNDGVTDVLGEYYENIEFRQHSLTVHLGYMFGYDAVAVKKGKSTLQRPKTKKRI